MCRLVDHISAEFATPVALPDTAQEKQLRTIAKKHYEEVDRHKKNSAKALEAAEEKTKNEAAALGLTAGIAKGAFYLSWYASRKPLKTPLTQLKRNRPLPIFVRTMQRIRTGRSRRLSRRRRHRRPSRRRSRRRSKGGLGRAASPALRRRRPGLTFPTPIKWSRLTTACLCSASSRRGHSRKKR